MEALFVSTGVVALAEIGDKTQLLAFILAARFKKPVPLGVELRVVGRIVGEAGRQFEGTGELLLPDGEVAATGVGRYVKLPLDRIADFDAEVQEWRVVRTDADPVDIALPEVGAV